MTYVIAEPCIDVMDQACTKACPVACIHFESGKDRKLYIDPNECIDCGACEPMCPVEAIYADLDLPTKWDHFTAIDALWYDDKNAARAKVDAVKAKS
jgi:NAD-dependent dihydropyrimidine dehydrogenase PreA subunit